MACSARARRACYHHSTDSTLNCMGMQRTAHLDGVGFFPESGGVFSHTHFKAFLCICIHLSALYCIFKALGRAAFYKSVTLSRILEPLRPAAFF